MYKSLCTDGLGVTIRQNELIEYALTFGYKGIEIDMDDMVGRADKMGEQFATQFVNSANVEISTFQMPLNFDLMDAEFDAQSEKLEAVCKLAKAIGAKNCYIRVSPTHPALQYHENFEKHCTRIAAIGEKMAEQDVRVGLQFTAGQTPGEDDMQFVHKPEEILALVKSVGNDNVGFVLDTWNWQVGGGTLEQIKELDRSKMNEVRLSDPPADFAGGAADKSKRLEPGTHAGSLAQETLNWLMETEYEGPVSLTAHIPKASGNTGEILFQRIGKVLDQMIAGSHGQQAEPAVAATDAEGGSEDAAEPVAAS